MPKVLLNLVSDDDGRIILKAASPPSVHADQDSPHSVGIRTALVGQRDAAIEAWLIVARKDAYRLADQISEKLQAGVGSGAEEMVLTLSFTGVLSGGVEKKSGQMVLMFSDKNARKYRILLPRDQSGCLADALNTTAKLANELADKRITEAGSEIAKIEFAPREAEVVMLTVEPLSGREVLAIRVENGLEYSFILTKAQSDTLRLSTPQAAHWHDQKRRPN